MKYKILAVSLFSLFAFTQANAAGTYTVNSIATWTAIAKKDSKSQLVVTPIGSLQFDYANGIKSFSTQKGLFDITITGDPSSSNFKLTSEISSNTLTQLDNSGSTLTVGVRYKGTELNATPTTLLDSQIAGNVGALSNLIAGAKLSSASSVQDDFTFYIKSATANGTTPASFDKLPEGIWSGDVGVQFDATWS